MGAPAALPEAHSAWKVALKPGFSGNPRLGFAGFLSAEKWGPPGLYRPKHVVIVIRGVLPDIVLPTSSNFAALT
jgi:hypothetical protein